MTGQGNLCHGTYRAIVCVCKVREERMMIACGSLIPKGPLHSGQFPTSTPLCKCSHRCTYRYFFSF